MSKKELPAVPQNLQQLLSQGRIRELNDVVDLAAEVASGVVHGDLTTNAARELRQWAELMYTCIQAQQVNGDGNVNFVAQLVQIAGGQASIENEPRKVIEAAQHPTIEVETTPELLEIEALLG